MEADRLKPAEFCALERQLVARMAMRNWMFRSPRMLRMLLKPTDKFATGIELRSYP